MGRRHKTLEKQDVFFLRMNTALHACVFEEAEAMGFSDASEFIRDLLRTRLADRLKARAALGLAVVGQERLPFEQPHPPAPPQGGERSEGLQDGNAVAGPHAITGHCGVCGLGLIGNPDACPGCGLLFGPPTRMSLADETPLCVGCSTSRNVCALYQHNCCPQCDHQLSRQAPDNAPASEPPPARESTPPPAGSFGEEVTRAKRARKAFEKTHPGTLPAAKALPPRPGKVGKRLHDAGFREYGHRDDEAVGARAQKRRALTPAQALKTVKAKAEKEKAARKLQGTQAASQKKGGGAAATKDKKKAATARAKSAPKPMAKKKASKQQSKKKTAKRGRK